MQVKMPLRQLQQIKLFDWLLNWTIIFLGLSICVQTIICIVYCFHQICENRNTELKMNNIWLLAEYTCVSTTIKSIYTRITFICAGSLHHLSENNRCSDDDTEDDVEPDNDSETAIEPMWVLFDF